MSSEPAPIPSPYFWLRFDRLLTRRGRQLLFMDWAQRLLRERPGIVLKALRTQGVDRLGSSYLGRFPVELSTTGGSITESVLQRGQYQFELMASLPKGLVDRAPTFVNVGANIGTTCLNAIEYGFKQLVAFEPVKANFGMLAHNLEGTGIPASLHHMGLGESKDSLDIHLHPVSDGRHSLKAQFQQGLTERIQIERLDDQTINAPFVLWIDTEGFELEVLRGGEVAITQGCEAMCLEVSASICGRESALKIIDWVDARFAKLLIPAQGEITVEQARARVNNPELRQFDLICLEPRRQAA